jgi:hypothetical protein
MVRPFLLCGFIALFLAVGGCNLAPHTVSLVVPFSYWISEGYCGAATAYMWSRYDNYFPSYSQQYIGDYLGIHGISGTDWSRITLATQSFTWSGRDAEINYAADPGIGDQLIQQARFFARQIQSLINTTPIIANFNGGHSVIIKGGSWSEPSTGLREWDSVTVHDPSTYSNGGPNVNYTAGAWTNINCAGACLQIISHAAWQGFDTYGNQADTVLVRGRRDWNTSGRFDVDKTY